MVRIDWLTGSLTGAEIRNSQKTITQMEDLFADKAALAQLSPSALVYSVQWWSPVPENTEGGLFWGTTVLEPGLVGREYFMTHGHVHAKADRTEFYGTTEGRGALILMDATRKTWLEEMSPGSLHHIPPGIAHRVANTGNSRLRFIACWPSDAGYDYAAIRKNGFGARLLYVDGRPTLVENQL